MKNIIVLIFNFSVSVLTILVGIPLLWIIKPFWHFQFSQVPEGRIGHLALDMDVYARDIRRMGMPSRTAHIFIAWNPANRQLLKMWKRHINIIENYFLRRCSIVFLPILKKTPFYLNYRIHSTGGQDTLSLCPPVLSFTEEEEKLGRRALEKMGIKPDDWFVCFHARDPLYLSARQTAAQSEYGPATRDCSIESYIPAMKWITEQGGFALRVGSISEQELPDLGPHIIDYLKHHRTDFMDIYLAAKCRFFMGNASGLGKLPLLFGKPTSAAHNASYMDAVPGTGVIFIPKFLKRKSEDRVFTFYECQVLGLFDSTEVSRLILDFPQYYEDQKLEWVENSADDVLDLCHDMMDLVEHREPPRALEARKLQSAYRSFQGRAFASPIGPRFALKYRDLIVGEE